MFPGSESHVKSLIRVRRAGLYRPGGLRNVGRLVRTKEEYETLVQMGAI